MLCRLAQHARLITRVSHGRRWISGAVTNCIYPDRPSAFEPLAVTVVKRFEPFTPAVVLLVQRQREGHPQASRSQTRVSQQQGTVGYTGAIPDWFEVISDFDNRPDTEFWKDRMWEVSTWFGKMGSYDTELAAYRLLHQLQGWYIPRLFGVVRLGITSESSPLHPIADVVQGLVLEYIPGVSMEKLQPGIDVSEQEAERICSDMMAGLRSIEAENCLLHSDIHPRNVILREGDRSPVIIDFGEADIRQPGTSDEDWRRIINGGPDTRYMRRLLVDPLEEDGDVVRDVGLAL
ncbi:hypothetical protein ARMSODRAFT_62827 [Armillaria solidipes]|uniref:Protein kinase domain-containing protein n=1 Tax=Armillaria solidipes TaxID=1076256 RepID=A0A2H3BJQ2_9AGAR|nr:hypothetical protein ARMSODRAFT_62827 [Armillaria solidipes]